MTARWVEHSFAPHMHDFYAVSLNCGGHGAFDCRRELHEATPGTCNLIGPGDVHTGRPAGDHGWSYRNLYIDSSLMTLLLRGVDWTGSADVRFKAPLVGDPILAGQLARVFECVDESSTLLEVETSLLTVVSRLVTDHVVRGGVISDARREPNGVRRVKEWLDAHAEENVSIQVLGEIACMSSFYLVRAFHRHVGVPPHRYQKVVRVNRARRLLAAGVPISEVAYQTGFCDQSHLNRCFKQTLGVTPGRYAAA